MRRAVLLTAFLPSILSAPAHAENLVPNAGFDTSLSPWTVNVLPSTWVPDDADGSATSGSIRVDNEIFDPVGSSGGWSPCTQVAPGPHLASVDLRLPTGQGSPGRAALGFRWYQDTACGAPLSASNGPELAAEDSTGAWTRVSETLTVPEGAAAFIATLGLVRSDTGGSLSAYYDNVALCPAGTPCPLGSDGWITDAEYPDFRFRVEITPAGAAPIQGVKEASCQPEVVCVSGALPGRAEVFLRLIGPRPNGFLWPTIVRFSPSRVDVEIEQLSTGQSRLYTLDAVPPGIETDLSGLQDREGFLP